MHLHKMSENGRSLAALKFEAKLKNGHQKWLVDATSWCTAGNMQQRGSNWAMSSKMAYSNSMKEKSVSEPAAAIQTSRSKHAASCSTSAAAAGCQVVNDTIVLGSVALLYESPGGNQINGLLLVMTYPCVRVWLGKENCSWRANK